MRGVGRLRRGEKGGDCMNESMVHWAALKAISLQTSDHVDV
jgi:hypothetical protein